MLIKTAVVWCVVLTMCVRQSQAMSALVFVATPNDDNNVKCDDTHYCYDGQTCCKLHTDEWGCCPGGYVSSLLMCCSNNND